MTSFSFSTQSEGQAMTSKQDHRQRAGEYSKGASRAVIQAYAEGADNFAGGTLALAQVEALLSIAHRLAALDQGEGLAPE